MREVINCFKKNNLLIQKNLKEVSVEEGLEIATELFQILNQRGDGIGLAANQVGIDAQVAVLNVREPVVLINPKIVHKNNEINYYEGCLSFPKKGCHTKRYETIEVTTAQEEGTLIFSGMQVDDKDDQEVRTLEAVCVQHEIDHLNGMRIFDRQVDTTIRVEKKPRRNQLVTIKKNEAVKVLKYKKAESLLNDGWIIHLQ